MSFLNRLINRNNLLLNKNVLIIRETKKSLKTTTNLMKGDDRRTMIKSLPKRDEGSVGEKSQEIDFGGYQNVCEFPDTNTPDRVFDNMAFKELPILHIKSTKNNTIFSLCKPSGQFILTRTCGMEGFKNWRKGTNVAAQATAINMSHRITKMGYKTVRVCIKGLGPGRMSSIKGLQMGGINIISITDTTPICEYPKARPPVAKSL